jgi:hypothetical protein
MNYVDLQSVLETAPYDSALVSCARSLDVEGIASRLAAGSNVISAANVVHYFPESVFYILEATTRVDPALRANAQAVMRAMCNKKKGRQLEMFNVWMGRQAALTALEECNA